MDRFLAAYGEPRTYVEVQAKLLKKYSFLPPEVLDVWKKHGLTAYKDGLLWFTNPDEYAESVKSLLGKHSTCVARTAFGDMICFDDPEHWSYFDAYTLHVAEYHASYNTLFNLLMTEAEWMQVITLVKQFKKALKKLGPLKPDEVYSFVPHPALGGSGDVSTLKKARIFEYLEILAQLR